MKKLLVLVVFVALGLIATSSAKECTVNADCYAPVVGPGWCLDGKCDWPGSGYGSIVN